ncbi:MAG: SDR family NAD(P)-dependent oxidoreductase [Pseudomonadota bacterium]
MPADRRRPPGRAIIVGAAGQLGAALADELAASGCDLGLCGRDVPALAALTERLRGRYAVDIQHEEVDVTRPATLADFFSTYGASRPVDWVVVCAGIGGARANGGVMEDGATADRMVAVNLLGALTALRLALDLFDGARPGRIVVIASLAAYIGSPESPVYAATKAGLRAACLSLRPALAARDVGVTIANPGYLADRVADGAASWRPFAMPADVAARRIVKAAMRGRAEIAFPWQMALLVRLLARLPVRLRERLYTRISGDPVARRA